MLETSDAHEAQPLARPRMLVVDDCANSRTTLSRRFERRGFEVLQAEGGREALEIIARGRIDLVLLDIIMPEMDGMEVLRQVRAVHSDMALPVIMVTAKVTPEDIVAALELGANDYITKPVNFPVAEARVNAQIARKQAEDRMRLANAELQASVAELEQAKKSLERAKSRAEAADRAKSEFLTNMSHEMRTPLNGIVAVADLLCRTALDSRQTEMATIIRSAGATLDELLTDILDLSRIEAGTVELRPEPVNLHDLLTGLLNVWRLKADEKGLSLGFRNDLPAGLCVEADPLRLKQILTNLIGNAVKFTDRGGVTLAVRGAEGADRGQIDFVVSDTGPGVEPDHRLRIFQRFQQADGTIARRFGGTGLGLPISRGLASLMGGRLDLRASDPGAGGSVFSLTVPLAIVVGLEAREPSQPPPDEVGSLRILLADDHPTNRTVVKLILSDPSIELVAVEDGRQAVDRFDAEDFDVVLMDMQMPVMDGLTATRLIRLSEQRDGAGRTPIIMLTANAMPEHIEAAILAGADLHLSKPITPAQLMDAIGRLSRSAPAKAGWQDAASGAAAGR